MKNVFGVVHLHWDQSMRGSRLATVASALAFESVHKLREKKENKSSNEKDDDMILDLMAKLTHFNFGYYFYC